MSVPPAATALARWRVGDAGRWRPSKVPTDGPDFSPQERLSLVGRSGLTPAYPVSSRAASTPRCSIEPGSLDNRQIRTKPSGRRIWPPTGRFSWPPSPMQDTQDIEAGRDIREVRCAAYSCGEPRHTTTLELCLKHQGRARALSSLARRMGRQGSRHPSLAQRRALGLRRTAAHPDHPRRARIEPCRNDRPGAGSLRPWLCPGRAPCSVPRPRDRRFSASAADPVQGENVPYVFLSRSLLVACALSLYQNYGTLGLTKELVAPFGLGGSCSSSLDGTGRVRCSRRQALGR